MRQPVPSPPSYFTGRHAELDHITTALRSSGIVAVHGMSGMGKTALAGKLAAESTERRAVLWASLGPSPRTADHLLDWARRVDPGFAAGDNPLDVLAGRVRTVLTNQVRGQSPVLVVLDDVWEGDSVAAARLLRLAAPAGAVLLITTGSPQVANQLDCTPFELGPMDPADAVDLLRELLPDRPAAATRELAELVGCHPLAVELAAGRVRLGERPELAAGCSLDQVLSSSYAAMDPADQACFRALGVLADGAEFDQELCRSIWGTEPRPVLDRLCRRGMLGPAAEPRWYRQHPLLRSHAGTLLAQRDAERAEVTRRYTEFIVGTRHDGYRSQLDNVADILVDGARDSRTSDRQFVQFLNDVSQGSYYRGDHRVAIRNLRAAQRIAEAAGDQPGLAGTYLNLGRFLLVSDPQEAPKALWPAVRCYQELADPRGLTMALLRLAEWQASPIRAYIDRSDTTEVLGRARTMATEAGYAEDAAEAALALGRLYDTLGNREAAGPLLAEAAAQFAAIGRPERAAVAHVFLAATLANVERFAEAESALNEAIALVRTTGYAVPLATALRNLGELQAHRDNHGEALTCFAEALPLVGRQTMRYLDEEGPERHLAHSFFTVRLEDAAGPRRTGDRERVAMPDELLGYLVSRTCRFAVGPESVGSWVTALGGFAARLAEHGDWFRSEMEFTQALIDSTLDRPAAIDDDNPYSGYVASIQARIRIGHAEPMPADEAQVYASNTLAVMLTHPERRDEWTIQLRRQRRGARQWGDRYEEQFYRGLLTAMDGRLIALPLDNPYRPQFDGLLETLGQYRPLQLQYLVENTVAAVTAESLRHEVWLMLLDDARRAALRNGERAEEVFVEALLAVTNGKPASVPADSPYRAELDRVIAAVEAGKLIFAPPPAAVLANVASQVVAARTTSPKIMDVVLENLVESRRRARQSGNEDEGELFNQLVELVDQRPAKLPEGSPFESFLREVVDAIGTASPAPCAADTIPDEFVEELADTVAMAVAEPDEDLRDGIEKDLRSYAATLDGRNADWAGERELVAALLAVLADEPVAMGEDNPYREYVDQARDEIQAYQDIRAHGGNLRTHELADFVGRTGDLVKEVTELTAKHLAEPGDFLLDHHTTERVNAKVDWREMLREKRHEVDGDPEWRHEVSLLDALIAVLDGQPASVPADSPYSAAFDEMLESIDYSPGVPDTLRVAALATNQEELRDYARDMFSGRAKFVAKLDRSLDNTVMAKTVLPNLLDQWTQILPRIRQTVAAKAIQLGAMRAELELIDALETVATEGKVELPAAHPYHRHIRHVIESIALFHGNLSWPGCLTDDQITRASVMTSSVLTIAPEHLNGWQTELTALRDSHVRLFPEDRETLAFLDAMQATLDRRPVDLSLDNRYRPYLHLTQNQIRAMSS